MKHPKISFLVICALMVVAMLLTACGTASTPVAEEPSVEQVADEPADEPAEAEEAAPEEPIKIGLFLPDKKTMRYDTKDRTYFEEKLN